MKKFNPLNCDNIIFENDLTIRTLKAAIYYIKRFYDCCDSKTYYEQGDQIESCIRNIKKMVEEMEKRI